MGAIKECLEEKDFHSIKEIASVHLKAKRKVKELNRKFIYLTAISEKNTRNCLQVDGIYVKRFMMPKKQNSDLNGVIKPRVKRNDEK